MTAKRLLAVLLCVALALTSLAGFASGEEAAEEAFSQWNPDAPAMKALI